MSGRVGSYVMSLLTFFLRATSVQSNVENKPPQTAKLPPILGASRLIAWEQDKTLRESSSMR